jgi:hypothetical protein
MLIDMKCEGCVAYRGGTGTCRRSATMILKERSSWGRDVDHYYCDECAPLGTDPYHPDEKNYGHGRKATEEEETASMDAHRATCSLHSGAAAQRDSKEYGHFCEICGGGVHAPDCQVESTSRLKIAFWKGTEDAELWRQHRIALGEPANYRIEKTMCSWCSVGAKQQRENKRTGVELFYGFPIEE